jgi:hypothetical protein
VVEHLPGSARQVKDPEFRSEHHKKGQKLIRGYNEQLYADKFEILGLMNIFLEKHNLLN